MTTDPLKSYLTALRQKHATGVAREHAYRPSLEQLLHQLQPGLTIINDPARIACGAPDFILLKDGVPLGYIEAKDVDVSLDTAAATDQLKRYRGSLHNLILTNYLAFSWYVDGELRAEATLGRLRGGEIVPVTDGAAALTDLLTRFFNQEVTAVVTAEELAKRMAHLAKLMDRAITATFEQEKDSGPFHAQLRAFQEALIPSLTPAEFADMYAQTLTYGLFAARVQQRDQGGVFNRDTIHKYLPSTNPFLSDFFYQISGRNMPDAVSWLVDDLAQLLRRADMGEILAQFGRRTRQEDPIIHFYETFLREYDPRLRQSRGVYYTPEPVVSYIVRSLDHILQTHFGRPLGLADPHTLILDPATGTGTFFYFVIQHIFERLRQMGQTGGWNSYVKTSLLPRLFGFELLMAPYAVAHLKLGLLLRELGYQFDSQERLNIFLTNALSEPTPPAETLGFAGFISQEGARAADVKLGKPIMVVLGNPPYSVSSSNNNEHITKLMDRYKEGVRTERNIQPLNDDYIKFIRFAHERIERTGYGIIGMITNHAYLSGLIHRGMREELLKTFSHIYILDLHGNAVTEGTAPDGTKDENVFDIRQGVAIAIFVKDSTHVGKPIVRYKDLWGKRETKYQSLNGQELYEMEWQIIEPKPPYFLFGLTNFASFSEYERGWATDSIWSLNSSGIKTHRDHFAVSFNGAELENRIERFIDPTASQSDIEHEFQLSDTRDWKLSEARKNLQSRGLQKKDLRPCLYRVFDERVVYFTNDIVELPRREVMDHLFYPNLAMLTMRRIRTQEYAHFFVSQHVVGKDAVSVQDACYISPLYVYTSPESTAGTLFATTQTTREPNLSREFIRTIEQTLSLTFTVPADFTIQPPTPDGTTTFTPEDIFYYAYAVFHSPTYRARYAEFLKIDFPRLPLTPNVGLFRQLARFGYELTQLHLMTHPALNQLITQFPVSGRNEVISGHPRYTEPRQDLLGGMSGRVYINQEQYFEGIAPDVWAFQVGGYQPLDKWLKDRRGRTLTFADILHYQRIVVALKETMRLMAAIDAVIPGWPLDGGEDEGNDDDHPPPPEPEPTLPEDAASPAPLSSERGEAGGKLDHLLDPDPGPPAPPLPLDQPLDQIQLFSKRVQNALMRSGVVTLRLLIMHTSEDLLTNTRNLGEFGLAEIETKLAELGLALARTPLKEPVGLFCWLAAAFYKHPFSRRLPILVAEINQKNRITLDAATVARAARLHPYLAEVETDLFQFDLHLPDATFYTQPEVEPVDTVEPEADSPVTATSPETEFLTEDGRLILHEIWYPWFATLQEKDREILVWRYGMSGDEPLTLKEAGERMDISRERVRQLETRALPRLLAFNLRPFWQPLRQLLSEAIEHADGLLLPGQWERFLDERVIWEGEEARPSLLSLLCALFEEFQFINTEGFTLATNAGITATHLRWLESVLKQVLRPLKKEGLPLEPLAQAVQEQLLDEFPAQLAQPAFIRRAIDLFERVGPGPDDRYLYLHRPKPSRHPSADSGWAGKPGTRLHEWEQRLRQQFDQVAWIGQLALSEEDFHTLCQIIRAEAQEPNYFTKQSEGQPRLVPAAVFMTTMVFSARYAEQAPDEDLDEFWTPYLRTVWQLPYTQAFMARCRKRFNHILPYLEQTFGFVFPHMREGDLVTPVFRHALVPRYMQSDVVTWLRKNWRTILTVSEIPALLATHIRQDKSLDQYYSRRFKHFLIGKATAETAAALISNMAAAISLHVNDGEPIASISDLLAGTPIEQELWREIAQEFQPPTALSATPEAAAPTPATLRLSQPRLTWVWSLDDVELALRVQNIILAAESELEGEPDRLVWLATPQAEPLDAGIEVEITPWRMKTGERLIPDVFLNEPDGPLTGQLVLLTDADEVAVRLDIPPHPQDEVQFFRLTQQGAYGIPVRREQVNDGTWLVCGREPLTFFDEDGELIEADTSLFAPYPLHETYRWAAQLSFTLPITVKAGAKKLFTLSDVSDVPAIGRPVLHGIQPVAGLSRQVQPTFASTDLSLTIEYGGERLLKQASLWLHGQDGWRTQRPLAELRQNGMATLDGTGLKLDLRPLLPDWANVYTLELRFSLQPIFPAPLQFAVVPGLSVEPPDPEPLYTPVNPPQVILRGLDESAVVRHAGLEVSLQTDGSQQITWTDLRHEPRLTLRFDKVDIPLQWSVKRFMAWLEPKPTRPFLTLEELRQTTLHAVGSHEAVSGFRLFVPGQRYREFPLRRGRFQAQIGQSQLYDMVRLPGQTHTLLKAQVGLDTWVLFEVRSRPQLPQVRLEYDQPEKMLLFSTGLPESWPGQVRFVAESLSNPFAPRRELHQTNQLKDVHLLPAPLPDSVYLLRLELDGAELALPEAVMRFVVGEVETARPQEQTLVEAIRSGQIISPRQAEDFVLWWAEIAEAGETELTPATLYQLATVNAAAAKIETNFAPQHLQKLWSPLVTLQAVQNQTAWLETHGYLPAWVLQTMPLTLKLDGHGLALRVFPLRVARRGREGFGYGHWRLSPLADAEKERVFVQWRPVSSMQVLVEAGLPDGSPDDWSTLEIEDTYTLYHCPRCGWLTGVRNFNLSPELEQAHRHGREKAELQPISYGDYQLKAEIIPERRGPTLIDIYETDGINRPAAAYVPEPDAPMSDFLHAAAHRVPLMTLLREIKRNGLEGALPLWASAARLLSTWHQSSAVTVLGQVALAFAVLLRSAAYQPQAFKKLRKDASLSESDCQQLVADFNQFIPNHLQWGLTWAELLYLHSHE